MKKKHQKHAKLARPNYGKFHRQEWGIIGATCGRIQVLSAKLIATLQVHYKLAYVDADNAAGEDAERMPVAGSAMVYTDKINHYQYNVQEELNTFHHRPLFEQVDGVLLNGNHFRAKRQIVVLDPNEEESLRRKLDCLTDVALILTTDEVSKPYEFLVEHLGEHRPFMMPLGDINGIIQWLRAQLTAARAPLYGLVLAGGKSQRMGEDKGLIDYHGLPQREYLAQQLAGVCQKVFYSLRPDQEAPASGEVIRDSIIGLGPFGAILSAFREYPDAAWLVVACDLPLLDREGLQTLAQKRNPSKLATAFHNPATGRPDPLVTIWEPRAYTVLLQFLAQGYSCPRKVLINSAVEVLQPENAQILLNANSPEERKQVLRELGG
ncbi:MAG: NTP transferase domain-containing protein [Bacteroidota bacterium]